MRCHPFILGLAGAGIVLCLTAAAPPAVVAPRLAGLWKRNPALSQDARAKVVEAMRDEAPTPEDKAFRDLLYRVATALNHVEIDQTDQDFKVIHDTDIVRIFYPGRRHVRDGLLGQRIQAYSHWEGSELMIEERDDNAFIFENLSLSAEGRLHHVFNLQDKRLRAPLQILTVYDREPPRP